MMFILILLAGGCAMKRVGLSYWDPISFPFDEFKRYKKKEMAIVVIDERTTISKDGIRKKRIQSYFNIHNVPDSDLELVINLKECVPVDDPNFDKGMNVVFSVLTLTFIPFDKRVDCETLATLKSRKTGQKIIEERVVSPYFNRYGILVNSLELVEYKDREVYLVLDKLFEDEKSFIKQEVLHD